MLATTVALGLEKSVNFALNRDSNSQERLDALEDNIICTEISDLKLTLYWLFEQQRIRIVSEWRDEVDATISGPIQAIARMGLSKAKVAKDLTVSGDMHVVEAFKELFAKLDIDWEAQLVPYTGDALAFKLGKTARQAGNFLQKAAKSFGANTKEYLQEEAQLLPSNLRLEDFANDVRELNRDVDRLNARIKRL